eukprot:s2591_g3.t3
MGLASTLPRRGQETPSLIGQRATHLDLGPQIQRGRDAQDRLPTSGTASLAWLEEEAPPRWSRSSLMSPKATSENMSRAVGHVTILHLKPNWIAVEDLVGTKELGVMITLEPGEVPCYMLLEQVQVPRVIGKAGAIIKELRQESGATVNILDKQLPEALQRSYHVAFAKSFEPTALQSAVLGLVRNARGPMALKSLGAEGQDVEIIEGLRKHRKVTLRAEETHDLQAELQLRMCQGALLTERDFDLQDTAWDDVMEAFRSKRGNGAQAGSVTSMMAEAPEPAVPLERLPTLTASSDVEAEARKARQLEQRDLEAQKEKERKKQLRVRHAGKLVLGESVKPLHEKPRCLQTRPGNYACARRRPTAWSSRVLACRRQRWDPTGNPTAHFSKAERYEEQARQAKGRSTRGYGIGPRAQQHEYQASEAPDLATAAAPSGEELRRQAEREEQIRQRKLRDQQAREKEQRNSTRKLEAAQPPPQQPAQPLFPRTEERPQPPQPPQPPVTASHCPTPAVNTRPLAEAAKDTNHQLDPVVRHPSPALSGDVADVALLVRLGLKEQVLRLSIAANPRHSSGQCPRVPPADPRRAREDTGVRRELEMLEEKMMRQVLRLQEQSERFMDIMMHPLEAKVAALEGRQPVIDCSIAELRGNLKGIQDSMEIQVRRSDQTETRMCNWRKTLEEELQQRMGEVNHRLGEGPAPSDTVSRSELVDLAKVLKKELKTLVEEAFRDGHVVSQKELTALGSAELGSVEKLAAETASAKLQGHQELMSAAEAVRAEMKTLTEKAIQEEALVRASMSALQELEKVNAEVS